LEAIGMVLIFLEIERGRINAAGPGNKFSGEIWEFQKYWFQFYNYPEIICNIMDILVVPIEEINI
jgi:hypothetical protein